MQVLKSLKNLDTLKIRLLCSVIIIWAFFYAQIIEFLTFDKTVLAQRQSKNAFSLFIISAVCLLIFYLCKKQDSKDLNYADAVFREKAESLEPAFTFACRLQKTEHIDYVREGLIHNFKKDFLEGGFYWAKYMLWRDNVISFGAFIRSKVIKFLS
jgi:hypothetical protein